MQPFILKFLPLTLKWECWKAGSQMLMKYVRKNEEIDEGIISLNGYVLLLLSGNSLTVINSYL